MTEIEPLTLVIAPSDRNTEMAQETLARSAPMISDNPSWVMERAPDPWRLRQLTSHATHPTDSVSLDTNPSPPVHTSRMVRRAMHNSPSLLDTDPAGNDDVLFSMEIDLESDIIAVTLHGELDISTGRRLLNALEPFTWNRRPWVRVDLDHVSFIDSSGAMAIIELSDWVARKDGFLEAGACPKHVERIFTMLGIPVPGVFQD